MKKKMLALLLACLCLSLAACAKTEVPAAEAPTQTQPAETPAAPAQTEETPTEETPAAEEAPALSGKVTVYMPSPAGLADKLAALFTEKTGVEVEQFQGTTGEILARLEAEQVNPVADVVILASWSDGLSMKADDKLESYTPANADKVNEGWIDEDSVLFGSSASAVGVIYNTTVVPKLSADWVELADAQYKDMIAIPAPEKSGACKDFLAGFVTGTADGEAILQSWADNGLTVPRANKAALEAVATGEKGILIAGVDYNAYSAMTKGEPLNIYYPASGTAVNPPPGHDPQDGPQYGECQGIHRLPVLG
mgnify:CR=1 FL=1